VNIIKQSWSYIRKPDGADVLKVIEEAGRTCYKTERRITDESSAPFVRGIIKNGHESVIEHVNVSVRIICDRGCSHQIVRHRIAAYSQESTRYCNYSSEVFGNQITVILPIWFYGEEEEIAAGSMPSPSYFEWKAAMEAAEHHYFKLLSLGQKPQQARGVLPTSLKTELVVTYNMRQWRHFFMERCQPAADIPLRTLALDMLSHFKVDFPVLFDDLEV